MENSRVSGAIVAIVVLACCVIYAVPGRAQPIENNRGMYVGTMVAVPFAQDLHHQTSFTVLGSELIASGDLSLGYGLGFAAIAGKGISDYTALELAVSWSRQPADLAVPPPAGLTNLLSELPALEQLLDNVESLAVSYDGRIGIVQSKIDLLLYPLKRAVGRDDGAKPYLGGGVGIVRSHTDLDIGDALSPELTSFLDESGLGGMLPEIPEKIDEKSTDFQLSLRAGVNVPIGGLDLDLGWQFYRTYVEGKDNNSHVAGGILKYVF